MGSKLLALATTVATTTTESTEEVSETAQKIVDWFNKTNTQAWLIVGGITVAVLGVVFLIVPKIKKKFK